MSNTQVSPAYQHHEERPSRILTKKSLEFIPSPEKVLQEYKILSSPQRIPQLPCINCGIMVSFCWKNSVDVTRNQWSSVTTSEYLTTYADLRLFTYNPIPERRMCITCAHQVS